MPGKHDHHDGHLHGHKPKHDGPPRGPKERELAVSLTIAVLAAAKVTGSIEDVEAQALATFERMLAGITKPVEPSSPLPQAISLRA